MIEKHVCKVFLALILLLIFTAGCGTPTAPIASSVPRQATQIPQILPTAVPREQVVNTTSETDALGMAEFQDPLNQRHTTVEVKDSDTKNPISGISVSFVSNGSLLLIIAIDPNKEYFPIVNEVNFTSGVNLEQQGYTQAVSFSKQVVFTVFIYLMKVKSAIQTYQDWVALYADPPDLDHWGFLSQDYCVNSDQMATGLRTAIDTSLFVMPGPTKLIANLTSPSIYQDLVWLTALAELNDSLMIGTAKDTLSNFMGSSGAIIKWRVYSINGIPYGVPAVPFGWCLEPLERTSMSSVSEWLQYGFRERDIYPFKKLTPTGNINGGIPSTEAGGRITGEELLQNLERSLLNVIKCEFININESSLSAATSGWNPPFILPYTTNLMTNEVSATNVPSTYVLIGASDGYISSIGIGVYPDGTDPLEVFSIGASNKQPCH